MQYIVAAIPAVADYVLDRSAADCVSRSAAETGALELCCGGLIGVVLWCLFHVTIQRMVPRKRETFSS